MPITFFTPMQFPLVERSQNNNTLELNSGALNGITQITRSDGFEIDKYTSFKGNVSSRSFKTQCSVWTRQFQCDLIPWKWISLPLVISLLVFQFLGAQNYCRTSASLKAAMGV